MSLKTAAFVLAAAQITAACGRTSASNACALPTSKMQVSRVQSEATNDGQKQFVAGTSFVAVVKDECAVRGPISGQLNLQSGVTPSGSRSYAWTLPQDATEAQLKAMTDADPCVEMLSDAKVDTPAQDVGTFTPPGQMPTDPQFALEKHLLSIGAASAYQVFYNARTGIKKDVVIAVIDSGVRTDHQDLRGSLWVNKGEIPNNGIDDDRNGYVDDVYGYNFASNIANPDPQETYANSAWQWAHGTRVAGLAAATAFNGIGGAGIAANAKIMALNDMGGSASMDQRNTANAVRYAIDNGADIINLSLGGNDGRTSDFEYQLRRAIAKGIVVFAAAGNEHMLIDSNYSAAGLAPYVPGLISVGNFQAANYNISSTSNYSTAYVKLGAPGTNTMYDLLYTTSAESSSAYSYFSGTSAATPVASGAAALAIGLIKSRGYAYTAADIENLMLQSARKIPALGGYFKNGNALDLAQLARLVDQRYPAHSGLESMNEKPNVQLEATSACPSI